MGRRLDPRHGARDGAERDRNSAESISPWNGNENGTVDAAGDFYGDGNGDRNRNEGKDKVENRHGTEDMDVDGMRVEMEMKMVRVSVPRDVSGPASPQSQRDATPRVKGACPAASPGGRGH